MADVTEATETPAIHRFLVSLLYAAMFVLGILGNTLVLAAVSVSRKLQTIGNTFIVALAVIDLISCLQIPVQIVAFASPSADDVFSLVCSMTGVFSYVSTGGNVILLAFIAFHRYVMVSMSLFKRRRLFNKRTIPAMISFSVAFPFTITLGFSLSDPDSKIGLCANVTCSIVSPVLETVSGGILLTSFAFMVTFYGLLFWHVRKHSRKIAVLFVNPRNGHACRTTASSESSSTVGQPQPRPVAWGIRMSKREMQITKSMVSVVFAFLIFVLPICCSALLPDDVTDLYHGYSLLLMHMTSVINPMLYAWKYPDFKKTFKLILTCRLSNLPMPAEWLRDVTGN